MDRFLEYLGRVECEDKFDSEIAKTFSLMIQGFGLLKKGAYVTNDPLKLWVGEVLLYNHRRAQELYIYFSTIPISIWVLVHSRSNPRLFGLHGNLLTKTSV